MESGIYCIENKVNHKKYIGQTHDFKYRWMHHRADLRGGIHHNRHLQSAWNIYGENNFLFYVVEEVPLEKLNTRESYWIQKFNTLEDGYNFDNGGDGIRGYKHTEEELSKMRRIQNPEVVLQFDLSFNFVKEWIGGCNHIRKELGGARTSYADRCNHSRSIMTPYKDSYWVYKKEYEDSRFSWNGYLNNVRIYTPKVSSSRIIPHKVYQYDFNGNLVKEWDSVESIGMAGYNRASVHNAINHKNGKKSYLDYVWSYTELLPNDSAFVGLITNAEKNNKFGKRGSKKVIQIDKGNGEILNIFNSCADAYRSLGVNTNGGGISVAARSNRTKSAYGYYWEYINE